MYANGVNSSSSSYPVNQQPSTTSAPTSKIANNLNQATSSTEEFKKGHRRQNSMHNVSQSIVLDQNFSAPAPKQPLKKISE